MQTLLSGQGVYSSILHNCLYSPHADTTLALDELFDVIDQQEGLHPEAAFIVAGDFNKANIKKVLPKFHQHVNFPTHGENDHVYTPFTQAHPGPAFGKLDVSLVLLLPPYRQKLKREQPMMRPVQRWTNQSDSALSHCFNITDWEVFQTTLST